VISSSSKGRPSLTKSDIDRLEKLIQYKGELKTNKEFKNKLKYLKDDDSSTHSGGKGRESDY
jgi:hypothetical protein